MGVLSIQAMLFSEHHIIYVSNFHNYNFIPIRLRLIRSHKRYVWDTVYEFYNCIITGTGATCMMHLHSCELPTVIYRVWQKKNTHEILI